MDKDFLPNEVLAHLSCPTGSGDCTAKAMPLDVVERERPVCAFCDQLLTIDLVTVEISD